MTNLREHLNDADGFLSRPGIAACQVASISYTAFSISLGA